MLCIHNDREPTDIVRVFYNFVNQELPKLRPGVALFITDSIKKFDVNNTYTSSGFVNYLLISIKACVGQIEKIFAVFSS